MGYHRQLDLDTRIALAIGRWVHRVRPYVRGTDLLLAAGLVGAFIAHWILI